MSSPIETSQDKVSQNAKTIVLGGLATVAGLVALYIVIPNEGAKDIVLATATGIIGFLAGTSDKLWGN